MASSEDKVLEFLISRLKDKQSEVLLRTFEEIKPLAAKADRALPGLREIYETNPDEQVKSAAQKLILDIIVPRLQNPDPTVVLQTIDELKAMGTAAKPALPILENLFKSSPNPNIQRAAQAAGLTIFHAGD